MQGPIKLAIATALICAVVAGCALPPLTGDLRSAREACNRDYPRRVGNYLPNAECVNAAVEAYALPGARHPDLVRLQEEIRLSLSNKIDQRKMSVQMAERRMASADRLVAEIEHDRENGNQTVANRRLSDLRVMLAR
jgi:hypothetical protein